MQQQGLQYGLASLKGFDDAYSFGLLVFSLIVVAICIVIRHVISISNHAMKQHT
jgi:hypothetical protein